MVFNESNYNKEWKLFKFEEMGEFNRGKSKHRPRNDEKLFVNGTIPFIQTADIKNANLYVTNNSQFYNENGLKQSKIWEKGTLCITIAANIADVAMLSYPACFPDSIVGFNANNEITTNDFVYYLFLYVNDVIKKRASGSTQDNINLDYLKNLQFYLPNQKMQNKIVNLLKKIDLEIINTNLISTQLELLAKEIYDYWFVQFDFPNEEGKPYKSSGGKMVYNEELKREIPEGWKVGNFNDIFEQVSGFPFSSDDYCDNGKYKLYTIKNVQDGYIESNVDNNIDNLPKKMDKDCLLSKGDILMSLTGNVGRVGIVYENNALLNQRVLKLKPMIDSIMYSYLLLQSNETKTLTNRIATGTSQKNLSPVEFGKQKILLVPCKILNGFGKICDDMYSQITNNYEENQKLIELRDFLLPMLMNGQITFKDDNNK